MTGAPRPSHDPDRITIADLVEGQVARRPDALAVTAGDTDLTYAELDRRANRLGRHLRHLGVGPDVPVAVFVERSVEMTVAQLAILKAGGACVPLDPFSPGERVGYLLSDSGASIVLTQQRVQGRLPEHQAKVLLLDAGGIDADDGLEVAPSRDVTPDHLAFVLYTSGSTGRPKGVMLTHRGLVNHHLAVADLYELGPTDRVLQFCSMSFDVSVEELFPTWAAGATAVLRDDTLPILGRSWLDWLRRQQVTVLNLPTAYWHDWVRDLQSLDETVPEPVRLVVAGGERALRGGYRTWMTVGGDRVRWLNAYGPTEASIAATFFEPPPESPFDEWADPPIGRPIANFTVHVLDANGRPVRPGDPGELHLGGVGLARGYWNQPDLTAQRFISDPFSDRPEARLYRTGDVVRSLHDGNLEFVGRFDDQVKVRGFRVECGEVEVALAAHPEVAVAAVVAREDAPGARRLVAYAVPAGNVELTVRDLRLFLSERLPQYMIPTAFVVLDAFPMTPGGKVDRANLPVPATTTRRTGAAPAPSTPTEEVLSAIWGDVLGLDAVGVDDDLFELGGHSLMATQVIARAREAFGVDVAMEAIYEAPTVQGLAARIDREDATGVAVPPLVATSRSPDERVPLSVPQEQMWRLAAQATPQGLYNITAQHRFAGPADATNVRRALNHLVQRHEALRTTFTVDAEHVFQTVAPSADVELRITDLAGVPASERQLELERRIARQDAQPIERDGAPLIRAQLFRLDDVSSLLAVTFDHLICDGTSAYIFLSEFADTYAAMVQGETPRLGPLPVQYTDFALWQRRWLTEDHQQAQLRYWTKKLEGMPRGPAVPLDSIPSVPTRRMASRDLTVTATTYQGLKRLARASRSTMFIVSAAAVESVLSLIGGSTDLVLSTTLSGRQRNEVEGVIGHFGGIGRIRTDLSGDPSFEETLRRTRETVLGLFEHQDIPFMKVRRALFSDLPSQGAGAHPLAVLPVEFAFFHSGDDGWAPGLGVVERPGPDRGAGDLFFGGQLHPLSVNLLNNGAQLWGELIYKTDFYSDLTIERVARGLERVLDAVATEPSLHLSQLRSSVASPVPGEIFSPHRPVGSWRLEP